MNKRSGKETKEKILDAARRVFARNGYAGSNIREIARDAGTSIGGVYLYFRNKEELYLSLLKDHVRQQMDGTEDIVRSARTPEAALSGFIDFHLSYALRHREMILSHLRERGFDYAMTVKKKFHAHQAGLLTHIIREGIRSDAFRRCDPDETAHIIMGFLRGIVISIAVMNIPVTVAGVREMIVGGVMKAKPARKRGGV